MSSSRSSSSERPAPPAAGSFQVTAAEAGRRIDKVLSGRPEIASREMAQRLLREGAARLNGAAAAPAARVAAGDRVDFAVPPPRPSALEPEPAALDVLYEDAALLVLNKPAGLSMHPGPGHPRGTLVHHLLAHCRDLSGIGGELRPGIVHRLDKDTSGVVVVAKTDAAHLGLGAQFRAHSIDRSYLAVVVGRPLRDAGTIDAPLARDPHHRLKRAVLPQGKRAVTHWRVEQRLGAFTLMRLNLETGRTHQIRVHLDSQGWPVLGDPLYGRGRHRGLRLPPELADLLAGFQRQALHASELGFTHPLTGARLHFYAPLPPDLQAVIVALAGHVAATAAAAGRRHTRTGR